MLKLKLRELKSRELLSKHTRNLVDVGAGERTQDRGVMAAESTQVRAAEADVAPGGVTSCSGSVVDWVED